MMVCTGNRTSPSMCSGISGGVERVEQCRPVVPGVLGECGKDVVADERGDREPG